MAKIDRSIKINAPVEKVFLYITDPMNQLQSHPGMTDIRNVTGRGESQKWDWTYKMMGISFKGKAEVAQSELNTRYITKTSGGIVSTWIWALKRETDGTLLTLRIDYTIPVPVIGKVGELLTLRQNEREADIGMVNIKERMEGLKS